MANSKYEYVKREFEFDRRLPPSNWIVLRFDGSHFHRFSKRHDFEKPNDKNALDLMNSCANAMLEKYPDIVFAYGFSDEYSFVFKEETEFYDRRESKILSLCVSYFSSVYQSMWKDYFPETELQVDPQFDARVVCYPNLKTIRDYLAWRQVDCHINNQYNTCFWMLVKSGKSEQEAQLLLKGTSSKDKNELLAQQFQMNYDDQPAMFRKGSSVYREKVETSVNINSPKKRTRVVYTVAHVDIIGSEFWQNHQHILQEGKCRHEFVKKSGINRMFPPSNWIVICINACRLDKPNDETALWLMNESASLMMKQYPDIVFGYGFGNEYSFVFHEKTKLYQRQESLILSSCSSRFTSLYVTKWMELFPHKKPPGFEAEALCYPKLKLVREFLLWRQAECHTSNQYNTCFRMLVKSGKGEMEAQETLKGTLSKDKNELLFQQFQMNYNNEPAMFRKGSCVYRQKVAREEGGDNGVTLEEWDVTVVQVDMGPVFWQKHPWIFLVDDYS